VEEVHCAPRMFRCLVPMVCGGPGNRATRTSERWDGGKGSRFGSKPARMDFTGFVVDHMGHFTLYDLPGAAFAVVMAAVLTIVFTLVVGGEARASSRELVLWSAGAALALVMVRGQLPVAVAFLALVMLAKPGMEVRTRGSIFFGALIIGMGCGSGAALVTAALTVPFGLVGRWAGKGA